MKKKPSWELSKNASRSVGVLIGGDCYEGGGIESPGPENGEDASAKEGGGAPDEPGPQLLRATAGPRSAPSWRLRGRRSRSRRFRGAGAAPNTRRPLHSSLRCSGR